jgi:single-stranded-DNA-specific exonuclease
MTEAVQRRPLSAIAQSILAGRGYQTADQIENFLYPSFAESLGDPFALLDMDKAVERIALAVTKNEPVVIYGDYDIDGLTATSLLIEFCQTLGLKVQGYIPDRFEEGYGINQAALRQLKDKGFKLVISVDCGITSRSEAAWAHQNGLDLIITDHHSVPPTIPDAIAVINPKRPGDPYPFKDLAGVGVAFKLVQALQQRLGRPSGGQEKWLLDLVALGTVCDVVTLVGENRVLVKYGLRVLGKTRRAGLQALAETAGVNLAEISSYHLGFMLGPRLNAAGRLEHAKQALELLTTENRVRASEIAEKLNQLNLDRRQQQAKILSQANQLAEEYKSDPVLVLAHPKWSHGIVGIVASKLVERWHKPALVLQILGQTAKGSARSVAGFNLVEGLRSLGGDYFIKLGGHHFAAGFTVHTASIDQLRADLVAKLQSIDMTPEATASSDIELAAFDSLALPLIEELELLEPFGNGNPKPIIALQQAKIVQLKQVGSDMSHLKLTLSDSSGEVMTALGFNMAADHPNLSIGQAIDLRCHLVKNDFLGQVAPELVIVDLK